MIKLINLGDHRHMMQHALDGVVTEPFLKKLVQLKKKHNKKRSEKKTFEFESRCGFIKDKKV